jgi:hypothetical protein
MVLAIIYVLFRATGFYKIHVLYVIAFLLVVFSFYLEILDVKNKLFCFTSEGL